MKKGEIFFDKNFVEIQEGDLLKVFHFIHYRRRRKVFMYHVVTFEEGYFKGKSYHADKSHYFLFTVSNKDNVITGAEVISKKGWEDEEQLREEARLRKVFFDREGSIEQKFNQ